jgi:hypothetical protein
MCGRFIYQYTWSEIHALYRLTSPSKPSWAVREVLDRHGVRWG